VWPPLWTTRQGARISTGMNIGTRIFTWLNGREIGRDARRWVDYAGAPEASKVPPEWHAWLHYTTEAPIKLASPRPWIKPHEANLTGTPEGYRPPGHDYKGGERARATGDYEAWSPDASAT
jgi:NADH:ubiquinone oxidoreductase subunit